MGGPQAQRRAVHKSMLWPVFESHARKASRWVRIVLQSLGTLFLAYAVFHFWHSIQAVFFLFMFLWCGLAAALNILHQIHPPVIVLTNTHLVDRSLKIPERIPLCSVSQVCEFSSCLEATHYSADSHHRSPALWRITSGALAPEHLAELAGQLKQRVRFANPNVRIYDAQTGPPPDAQT